MKKFLNKISKGRLRTSLSYLIFIFFVTIFIVYLRNKPGLLDPLFGLGILPLLFITLLYVIFLLTSLLVVIATVSHFKKSLGYYEAGLLTAYSTLVNFFGPLQSGPGYRAIYLKAKHGIKIKDYTLISTVYYAAFGSISLLMLFATTPIIFIPSLMILLGLLIMIRIRGGIFAYSAKTVLRIFMVTLLQLMVVGLIYFTELKAVGSDPSIPAAIAYTGSANLALFVAITPGAIGIRESFIFFAQSLHNIPSEHIIAASILDRSIYFVFLFALFILSSTLHIKQKLASGKASEA